MKCRGEKPQKLKKQKQEALKLRYSTSRNQKDQHPQSSNVDPITLGIGGPGMEGLSRAHESLSTSETGGTLVEEKKPVMYIYHPSYDCLVAVRGARCRCVDLSSWVCRIAPSGGCFLSARLEVGWKKELINLVVWGAFVDLCKDAHLKRVISRTKSARHLWSG